VWKLRAEIIMLNDAVRKQQFQTHLKR
jgi:hypothetical protein